MCVQYHRRETGCLCLRGGRGGMGQGPYRGIRQEPQHGLSPVPRTAWLQDAAPGRMGAMLTHVYGAGTPVPSGAGAEAAARASLGGAPHPAPAPGLPVGAAATLRLARRSGPLPPARGQELHGGGQPPSPQAARWRLQPTEFGKARRKTPGTQTCRLNRARGAVVAVRGPQRGQQGSLVTGGPAPGPWGGDREEALCSSGTRASRL